MRDRTFTAVVGVLAMVIGAAVLCSLAARSTEPAVWTVAALGGGFVGISGLLLVIEAARAAMASTDVDDWVCCAAWIVNTVICAACTLMYVRQIVDSWGSDQAAWAMMMCGWSLVFGLRSLQRVLDRDG